MATRIVDVLVPVALDKAYSYRVPEGVELAPGDLVSVPLGATGYTAVVWGEGTARPGLDNRLKDDEETLETVVLPPQPVAEQPDPDFAQPDCTTAQERAAAALRESVRGGVFSV